MVCQRLGKPYCDLDEAMAMFGVANGTSAVTRSGLGPYFQVLCRERSAMLVCQRKAICDMDLHLVGVEPERPVFPLRHDMWRAVTCVDLFPHLIATGSEKLPASRMGSAAAWVHLR